MAVAPHYYRSVLKIDGAYFCVLFCIFDIMIKMKEWYNATFVTINNFVIAVMLG
jgi:hypothetical protein